MTQRYDEPDPPQVCGECGSLLAQGWESIHREWHRQIEADFRALDQEVSDGSQ